eukprot:8015088-Alexandrium_andersonii.AAC.1
MPRLPLSPGSTSCWGGGGGGGGGAAGGGKCSDSGVASYSEADETDSERIERARDELDSESEAGGVPT